MAGNYYEAAEAYDEALLLNAASSDAQNGKARIASPGRFFGCTYKYFTVFQNDPSLFSGKFIEKCGAG